VKQPGQGVRAAEEVCVKCPVVSPNLNCYFLALINVANGVASGSCRKRL
jgi:hypothetical protein